MASLENSVSTFTISQDFATVHYFDALRNSFDSRRSRIIPNTFLSWLTIRLDSRHHVRDRLSANEKVLWLLTEKRSCNCWILWIHTAEQQKWVHADVSHHPFNKASIGPIRSIVTTQGWRSFNFRRTTCTISCAYTKSYSTIVTWLPLCRNYIVSLTAIHSSQIQLNRSFHARNTILGSHTLHIIEEFSAKKSATFHYSR